MKKSILAVPKKEQTNFLLSVVIAAAAAYVDATGFLLYSGIYLSFMSGNTTRAAVFVGRGDWQQVAPAIGAIPHVCPRHNDWNRDSASLLRLSCSLCSDFCVG